MKENRGKLSMTEEARQIFEQLDRCVEGARKYEGAGAEEKTEAKVKADREAQRLDYLTGFGWATMVIANSVALISGLACQNWVLVIIYTLEMINAVIGLYVWHR